MKSGLAMMTLPRVHAVVAKMQHNDLVAGPPFALRFMKDENQKPLSRRPCPGEHRLPDREADVLDLDFRASILFGLHEDRPLRPRSVAAGGRAPCLRGPGRPDAVLLSVTIEKAGVSYTIITAFTAGCAARRGTDERIDIAKPTSYAPEATG